MNNIVDTGHGHVARPVAGGVQTAHEGDEHADARLRVGTAVHLQLVARFHGAVDKNAAAGVQDDVRPFTRGQNGARDFEPVGRVHVNLRLVPQGLTRQNGIAAVSRQAGDVTQFSDDDAFFHAAQVFVGQAQGRGRGAAQNCEFVGGAKCQLAVPKPRLKSLDVQPRRVQSRLVALHQVRQGIIAGRVGDRERHGKGGHHRPGFGHLDAENCVLGQNAQGVFGEIGMENREFVVRAAHNLDLVGHGQDGVEEDLFIGLDQKVGIGAVHEYLSQNHHVVHRHQIQLGIGGQHADGAGHEDAGARGVGLGVEHHLTAGGDGAGNLDALAGGDGDRGVGARGGEGVRGIFHHAGNDVAGDEGLPSGVYGDDAVVQLGFDACAQLQEEVQARVNVHGGRGALSNDLSLDAHGFDGGRRVVPAQNDGGVRTGCGEMGRGADVQAFLQGVVTGHDLDPFAGAEVDDVGPVADGNTVLGFNEDLRPRARRGDDAEHVHIVDAGDAHFGFPINGGDGARGTQEEADARHRGVRHHGDVLVHFDVPEDNDPLA